MVVKMKVFLPWWFVGLGQNAVVWIKLPANIRENKKHYKEVMSPIPPLISDRSVTSVSKEPSI